MSKRFILLLIASFIFLTGSFIFAEGKKIDAPILIQLGTQHIDVNDDDTYFSLSYLTNYEEDVRIEAVRIGTVTLYPEARTFNFYPFGEMENDESLINEYTYYDLHNQQISLDALQILTIQNYLEKDKMIQVLFSNGIRKDYSLDLAFDKRPYGNKEFSNNPSSTIFDDVLTVHFTAKEDATIEQISSTFVHANVTLFKDNIALALPYNATPGEELTIEISPNYRLGNGLVYYTYIEGTFATGEHFVDYFDVNSFEYPDEGWIKNYIEKVGGK